MTLSPVVDKPVDITPVVWETIKQKLKEKVRPVNFNNWFKPITHGEIAGDNLVISVPNKFIADWINDFYAEMIEKEAHFLLNKEVKVRFDIAVEQLAPASSSSTPGVPQTFQRKISAPFNHKYTFESFVVGKGNQLAHAACQAVSEFPGGHYNPLFIHGGVGLGKTHLLNAVALSALRRHPEMKIIYISSEKFMNEFITCVQNSRMKDFRKKYRESADMLLIDDIQFLGGKGGTQEEFFHTFNELRDSHRQIVLTADKLPKELPGIEERLRSRFAWGLIADVQPPDFETRVAILREKAAIDKISLADDVALYLAEKIESNVRELEGALIRLNAFSSLKGSLLTIDLAKEVLHNQFKPTQEEQRMTVEEIQKTVAEYYQIGLADLKSPRRLKNWAHPRQVAMYLCKKHLRLSFPEIGNRFGGKDHTTVMHACRKIERLLLIDNNLQNDIAILEKTIV